MLSETLIEELGSYGIGGKLRGLRNRRGLTLAELASHSGLSVALLSKIERDKVVPTLPTLTRVALVFGVGLNYFFTEEREKYPIAVVREGTRKRFPQRQGMVRPSFEFESLDYTAVERKMNSYLAEFNEVEPDQVKMHRHEGAEFLYVLSGSVAIVRNEEEVILEAGDSAYFESHVSHGYRRVGDEPARAIVVTTV